MNKNAYASVLAILNDTPTQNHLGESAQELNLVGVSNVPCRVIVPSPPAWRHCSLHARSARCTGNQTRGPLPWQHALVTPDFCGKRDNTNKQLLVLSLKKWLFVHVSATALGTPKTVDKALTSSFTQVTEVSWRKHRE